MKLEKAGGLLVCMCEGASFGILEKSAEERNADGRIGTSSLIAGASATTRTREGRGGRRVFSANSVGDDDGEMARLVGDGDLVAGA